MKNNNTLFFVLVFLILAAVVAFSVWGVPYFFHSELPPAVESGFGSGTTLAKVVSILDEGRITLGDHEQPYQIMQVEILSGDYKGAQLQVDYGKRQVRSDEILLRPGDKLLVSVDSLPDGRLAAYFVDFVRSKELAILGILFVVAILAMAKRKGLGSLLGLSFSLLIVIKYIIPHILQGEDPVRVSIIGSTILLGVTLYLTYGWNLKTHAAVVGMLLSLILTGTLAWVFVVTTKLTGAGDESALYLIQMSHVYINLRGLLLGGMLVGALGVLDDLVITQASAIFEIHDANPSLGFGALYKKASRIGEDHVAATVNTLVMAYAGASLPILLIFSLSRGNFSYLVNFSFIAEEIVRTLVGSLGLIAAVPITTAIASFFALYAHKLGSLRPLLGPENSGGVSHHHA